MRINVKTAPSLIWFSASRLRVLVPRPWAAGILFMGVACQSPDGDDDEGEDPLEPQFCQGTEESSCPAPSLVPYSESLGLNGASVLIVDYPNAPQGVAVFSATALGRDSLILGFSVHEDDCSHICMMPEACTTTVCTNLFDCTVCLPEGTDDAATACFQQCGE